MKIIQNKKYCRVLAFTAPVIFTSAVLAYAIYKTIAYDSPKIQISEGLVSGVPMITYDGRAITAFLGIPYAQPPIGHLRFKNPVRKNPWSVIHKAIKDGPRCPQMAETTLRGEEDCLYLNVFTPKMFGKSRDDNHELLPVMFWIHGGGYRTGSSYSPYYNPRYLLDRDVVLVTINYRLGILGFLSTGDSASPGNYGLKDMVLALEWVQRNIHAFGGDHKRVTIFGESAGGAAVELLMLSNATNGLFQRCISQSGSAVGKLSLYKQPKYATQAEIVGNHFNCPKNDSEKLIDCLRNLTTLQLLNDTAVIKSSAPLWWGPTTEPDLPGAVITDVPSNTLERGELKKLDWMTGVVKDESLAFHFEMYKSNESYEYKLRNIDGYLGYALRHEMDSVKFAQLMKDIKEFYFNNTFTDKNKVREQWIKVGCDKFFLYPTFKVVQQKMKTSSNPFYIYSLNYCGSFGYNLTKYTGISNDCGVGHGDDLTYLFDASFDDSTLKMSENDMKVVKIMVDLWTSFATNGTPVTTAANNSKIWEPYNIHENVLYIGDHSEPSLTLNDGLFNKERIAFWDAHYPDMIN